MNKLAGAVPNKRSLWTKIRQNSGLYLLLLPAIILTVLFMYKPMYGVIIAFKEFRPSMGIFGSAWADPWYKHFQTFFESFSFGEILRNTLVITIYSMIVNFPLPIMLALSINQMQSRRFRRVYQTVIYLPHFISTVVMVGLILMFLSPGSGLIANLAQLFGAESFPNLMAESKWFSSIYVWTDVWQHVGWNSIIYIAALSAVDVTLYEAAAIDGASRFQRLLYIDLPMLIPTAIIMLILSCGNIMNVGFEKVYLMQNGMNLDVSEVISTYVYKIGIINTRYSYSAAIGLFNNVINFVLLVIVNKISKKLGDTSLW